MAALRVLGTVAVALAATYATLWALALVVPVVATTILQWVLLAVVGVQALVAGVLGSYDLSRPGHWLTLVLDHTWSLPNTVFGGVVGNVVYPFLGDPSRAESAGQTWIAYMPRGSSGFGTHVLQTLGLVNLGGAGQHERMHLLQARLFGPAYLPLFALFYVVTTCVQLVFMLPLGLLLWVLKVRDTPYLRPPARSAVGGFFGWIYYATPFELWAYASGNP